jgi:Putative beta-barrel porin-2, OmpL-like. bbp2/Carboxypeptidase regulatory-like domain
MKYLARPLCQIALMALLSSLALRAIADNAAPPSTSVKVSHGAIVGIVTNAVKSPVAGATVTAISAAGAIRATISGSDGVYSFADLAPGVWSLRVQATGVPDVSAPALQVIAGEATRHDITMAGAAVAATPPPVPAPTPVPAPVPAPAVTAAAPAVTAKIPEALEKPEPPPENDTVTPWADVGYVGWMNGTPRSNSPIFDTKFFTPEIRFDMNYLQSLNRPKDHTISGSTEEFRSGEFQIEQVSFGGDFHWENVRARFLAMYGMFAVTTPRNDASSAVGQWDLQGAYKYFSEANAGYHWDVAHGLNVDLGVFVSYVGLFSYYNFDNWTYQPSFVSSNTPWFFNGMRIQFWPTQHLKIEPWIINGWQSYAKFNKHPGLGGQILFIPNDSLKLVFNTYFFGQDNLATGSGQPNNGGDPNAAIGLPNPNAPFINYAKVQRIHEDDSILVKYYDSRGQNGHGVSRMAFSYTLDFGCEHGGGVSCTGGTNAASFLGMMAYNRIWWNNNIYAVTLGGGFMDNPGRYLALVPPINGATAATGTPYFTENPGQKLFQWDAQLNFQYMPKDWITWWTEATFRHSSVPYWTGSGGITPPLGNTGSPAAFTCNNGSVAGTDNCANEGGIWYPDLRTRQIVLGAGVMVKF